MKKKTNRHDETFTSRLARASSEEISDEQLLKKLDLAARRAADGKDPGIRIVYFKSQKRKNERDSRDYREKKKDVVVFEHGKEIGRLHSEDVVEHFGCKSMEEVMKKLGQEKEVKHHQRPHDLSANELYVNGWLTATDVRLDDAILEIAPDGRVRTGRDFSGMVIEGEEEAGPNSIEWDNDRANEYMQEADDAVAPKEAYEEFVDLHGPYTTNIEDLEEGLEHEFWG